MKKFHVFSVSILLIFLCACSNYENGYKAGQEAGYSDGYDAGYKDGYDDGRDDGYSEGYEEGRIDYDDTSDDITRAQIIPDDKDKKSDISEAISYIGNKNTKKFHKSTCSSINDIKESNKVFESREYFIEHDYQPCKKCKP